MPSCNNRRTPNKSEEVKKKYVKTKKSILVTCVDMRQILSCMWLGYRSYL